MAPKNYFNNPGLSTRERWLIIKTVKAASKRKVPQFYNLAELLVDRASTVEFDVSLSGRYYDTPGFTDKGTAFLARLDLFAISELADWEEAIAMSDYPYMEGDWSAIRDSSPAKIAEILRHLVLEPLNV